MSYNKNYYIFEFRNKEADFFLLNFLLLWLVELVGLTVLLAFTLPRHGSCVELAEKHFRTEKGARPRNGLSKSFPGRAVKPF